MSRIVSDKRRPEIVEAAIRSISKNGLPAPSYDKIAEEAGISRQLIRHYFPNPEAMMVELCSGRPDVYRAWFNELCRSVPPRDHFKTLLDVYFTQMDVDPAGKRGKTALFDAMMCLAINSETIRTNLRDQFSEYQELIANVIATSFPALSAETCRELGFLILGLVFGHSRMVAMLGFSTDYNQVVKQAIEDMVKMRCDMADQHMTVAAE